MTGEDFALLRTHRNNIHRYRRLLETPLSALERQYLERRLSEEQTAIEILSRSIFPLELGSVSQRPSPATA
ncbi:hypothetical protein ACVJH7_000781 [Bradyrhizobium elkanii]